LEFSERLTERKRNATLEGLFRLSRLLNESVILRARERTGNANLRAAHTALLPHIDLAGTRLTTLAERLGVTKQAAGQLVDELEAQGVIERVPDAEDGRAKLVRFSAKGRQGLLEGLELLRELEAELAESLGARRWKEFRSSIFDLLEAAARLRR
jgi:DNA-binding MarR family transcriptional regulator